VLSGSTWEKSIRVDAPDFSLAIYPAEGMVRSVSYDDPTGTEFASKQRSAHDAKPSSQFAGSSRGAREKEASESSRMLEFEIGSAKQIMVGASIDVVYRGSRPGR
jgi:hypothetical protein